MPQRRPLGDILMESGRITKDDIEHVLEYQRAHGGFFGQGLVALGVVSREEIDWALASQFDLPFVFPNAGAVDRDVAHLVPADWALAQLAVPLVRAGDTIRVVVADPLRDEVIEDLRVRTGCDVELALASEDRIRQLIHTVYAEPAAQRVVETGPLAFDDLIAQALDSGAERFGVSIRGMTAIGWWRGRGSTRRVPLAAGWNEALLAGIRPSHAERVGDADGGRVEWQAQLSRGGVELPLAAQALVGENGTELLFRPLQQVAAARPPGDLALPAGIATELRLLWQGGDARIGLTAGSMDETRSLLPLLPALALGQHVRAVHISENADAAGTYTVRAETGADFVTSIASCEFDAITVDLPVGRFAVDEIMKAAPLSFTPAVESGGAAPSWLNWQLTATGQPGSYAWDLRALHH